MSTRTAAASCLSHEAIQLIPPTQWHPAKAAGCQCWLIYFGYSKPVNYELILAKHMVTLFQQDYSPSSVCSNFALDKGFVGSFMPSLWSSGGVKVDMMGSVHKSCIQNASLPVWSKDGAVTICRPPHLFLPRLLWRWRHEERRSHSRTWVCRWPGVSGRRERVSSCEHPEVLTVSSYLVLQQQV